MAKKHLRIFSLGGNEVSPSDMKDPNTGKSVIPDISMQWQRTADTCKAIVDFIEKYPDDMYVITHGNGPQVGNILLRAEYSRSILHSLPLDVCGADTQGAMGYMLSQINNELRVRGISKLAADIVTQTIVSKDDPDFKDPSKFIGPSYTKEEAMDRKAKEGWNVKFYGTDKEGKEIWRRVVPSPEPIDIVEYDAIFAQLKAGLIPICVGGGGIPVTKVEPRIENGEEVYEANHGVLFKRPHKAGQAPLTIFTGCEAVIDKDLGTALLGSKLAKSFRDAGEDVEISLAILTAEDGAKLNYKKPDQIDLRKLTLKETAELYNRTPPAFPPGSMGPKIKACMKFIEGGGQVAYVSRTPLLDKTVKGEAGTTIVP